MRTFREIFVSKLFLIFAFCLVFSSCKKEEDILYGVKGVEVFPQGADKGKVKSPEQFLSILYANLFQQALPSNQLVQLSRLVQSIGDKDVAYEIIISNFMNRPDVILPTNEEMREDIEAFIEDTYKRFFVRPPSEIEKVYFINYLENNQDVTPELVFFAFALSEEYRIY